VNHLKRAEQCESIKLFKQMTLSTIDPESMFPSTRSVIMTDLKKSTNSDNIYEILFSTSINQNCQKHI